MELIIGGCFQGKSEFARLRYEEKTGIKRLPEEWFSSAADGRHDTWEKAWEAPAIEHFEQYIKRISIKEGSMSDKKQWITEWMKQVVKKNPESILVMDEIGCGIVPMERAEREYRDLAGFAGQLAAKQAEHVYRVIVGIGSRIR